MPDKVHKTKGIVLRTVKYGETSVIVTILTGLFGVQSYLVNGVRVSSKKGSGKANLFQPTAILDLVVYHNELKQLQRIKEFRWAVLYEQILSDVQKNAVALFMVELLTKCLKQPEPNADLFNFCEDAFIHLDKSTTAVMANFPLFFALHLPYFFGFRIEPAAGTSDGEEGREIYLDLVEGEYVTDRPAHPHFLEGRHALYTLQLLKVRQPSELADLKMNQDIRRELLFAYEKYYALHVQEFGSLKTIPVLKEILS
jgi:DNA repair protein RecO (recombination protein O)